MRFLFRQESTSTQRTVVFSVVSVVLMVSDHNTDWLDGVRASLDVAVAPVYYVAELPSVLLRDGAELLRSRGALMAEIRDLEDQNLLLRADALKMSAMRRENERLRDLLRSAQKLEDDVLVAELIFVNPNPDWLEIGLDKGSRDRVFVGQPVVDAQGLLGQVSSVSERSCRVLLITDDALAVPVRVHRNNLRLIASGSGVIDELIVRHVHATADLRKGDLLVTSGLGGRFPAGYPVGVVTEVASVPGDPFVRVRARPLAALDRSQHVLLVFSPDAAGPALPAGEG
jgi:rod shape-determining protein MreC